MRNVLALAILICGPAALGIMAWGLFLIYETAGILVFLTCCAVMVIAGLSLASLIDNRQQPPHQ